MKSWWNAVCTAAAITGLTGAEIGRAAIIGTTGAVVMVATPPADVSSNNWESNTQIRAFNELQGLTLPVDTAVDISVPGTSPSAVDSNLSPATLAAGTVVNCYALHFDVVGTRATDNALELTGSVTFSDPVLGLIALASSLNATNAELGLAGVTYSDGTDHGLELNPAGGGTSDVVTLSADRRTVSVDLRDASFADDLRIVTAVPEPGTLAVMGGLGVGWLRRRGRHREGAKGAKTHERSWKVFKERTVGRGS